MNVPNNDLVEFENFFMPKRCYTLNKEISKYWPEKLNNKMNSSQVILYIKLMRKI